MKIIKICLLIVIAIVLFFALRWSFSGQGFVRGLDDWLDQFQSEEHPAEIQSEESSVEDEAEKDHQQEDDDDDEVPSRVVVHQGLPAVQLAAEIVSQSGIKTSPVKQGRFGIQTKATAQVVDPHDLLDRQEQYHKSLAKLEMTMQRLQSSKKIYDRLRMLHKERANVSLQQVEEASANLGELRIEEKAIHQGLKAIRTQTRHAWGKVLTNQALGSVDPKAEQGNAIKENYFDQLIDNTQALLLVTLPAGMEPQTIQVSTTLDRVSVKTAEFISAALQNNSNTVHGLSYYYRCEATDLRLGMLLYAWLDQGSDLAFEVPLSAVIWYAGQPWVYVQVDDDLYARRPISEYRESDSGWFIEDGFDAGEMIVTQGAQLLLSEELRWQIPDEDDD